MKIINVTPENANKETLFCIKNIKSPAFKAKYLWFESQYKAGLRMKILKDEDNKMIGFIEYIPASSAWRPIKADNFMFIHCMYVYSKADRNKGYGSMLISEAEKEAKAKQMNGLCVMTSKGSWLADKRLFEQIGFEEVERKGRFELLSKKWNSNTKDPKLLDWTKQQGKYMGWNLVYADQCPWHEKSVEAILNVAHDFGVNMKVTKLNSAQEARKAPSGFGVFNLLYDGKLIEDHYLSATRFKTILQKELAVR